MKVEVKVPAVGESIVSGIISRWLVKNNETIREGDTLFEMETDKVNFEVPAPASGKVEILVGEGEEVKIDQLIGTIDTEAGAVKAVPVEAVQAEKKEEEPLKTSPSVRRVAAESHINLKSVEGSGKDGRIIKDDLLNKTSAPEVDKRQTVAKMTQIRRTIAKRLVQAKQEAAHLTTFNEINMEHVIHIRKKYQDEFTKKHGIKLGFMSFFVRACCQALKEFPDVNTMVRGEDIVYNHYYNIGVAVSVDEGLIVPVIKDADKLSFAQIELKIAELSEKGKNKKISLDDLQDGTFTITNGGIFGSMMSTPIPNYPQTAILGMHAITDRPVAVEGKVEIKPVMFAALTYDHRVIDGKDAVLFLAAIKNYIEDPESLLIEL